MSLLTYRGTRPWARAIKDRVVTRQMPPWRVDRGIGEYTADFYPSEIVDPGLTEDRYVKWVQIIPEAYCCCVHHSHVYVSVPETAEDLEEFRLGMGSNTAEIDLIEYAMGSTGQYYPEGTGRKLPAGGLFRFAPHYHPWGEETIDRQKVGIKFYPKGEVPELIVTAHRIRTGIGHDWKLNREAVEDRLYARRVAEREAQANDE